MSTAGAAFDTGPLSWVKSEIDSALQRAQQALGDAAVKQALAHLHQAGGALQIVGLEGITRINDELEGLLADIDRQSLPGDADNLALAQRGVAGIADYLDQLMSGASDQPLRLLPLYSELVVAREPKRSADPVDLYFPNLGHRPPRREHVPVTLHSDEVVRYFRDQRARYQRGFVNWLKKDAGGAADMLAAVVAIENTQGPTPQRAFWWVATACFEALVHDALPQQLDLRRLCNRVEAQIRRFIDGSPKVAEHLLREVLYLVAQARPETELIRQVQQTFRLADTLLAAEDEPVQAPTAALKVARELLDQAKQAWTGFASGHPPALAAFNAAAGGLAQQVRELGQPALSALAARIAEVGEWAGRDNRNRDEAVALEQAAALLLAEHALQQQSGEGAAGGDTDLTQLCAVVCDRLAAGMRGKLLRTLPGVALLDEMSRQAQQRLLVNQVVAEMKRNLRTVESVLDEFFRDPTRRAKLATLDQPLTQLDGGLEVLGESKARSALAAAAAEIARIGAPSYQTQQAEFEAVAQALSGLGFYIEALAHGPADFDAIVQPIPAQAAAADDGSGEPTVETQLAEQQKKTHQAFQQWSLNPANLEYKADLQSGLSAIRQDAGLVGDAALEDKAAEALRMVEAAALPVAPALAQAVLAVAHGPAPVAEASPSAQAARLIDASAESVDAELLEVYLEEASEVLATVGEQLQRVRQRDSDAEALTSIRRGFHTLKGSGRMVGLVRLGEVAWSVEQTLNRWIHDGQPASPDLMALVEAAQGYFSAAIAQLRAGAGSGDASALLAMAEAVRNGTRSPGSDSGIAVAPAIADGPAPATAPPPPAGDDATVMLGEHSLSATVFTLFSGEAHALLNNIREEHETLRLHGIVSDAMLRATHTLAGIAGTVELGALRDLARAFEAALSRLSVEALSVEEEELVGESIEAIDAMVSAAIELRAAAAQPALINRLERAAAATTVPQTFHRDDTTGLLPEEEAALPRREGTAPPDGARVALVARGSGPSPAPAIQAPAAAPGADDASLVERRQRRLDELDPQLLEAFVEEAGELMPAIGAALREWRSAPDQRATGHALQRLLHTFKGGARMAGAMALGELLHNMENRVEKALAREVAPTALFDDLDVALDQIGSLYDALAAGDVAAAPAAPGTPPQDVASALDPSPLLAAAPVADAAPLLVLEGNAVHAMLRVRADVVDRLVIEAGEVSIARSRIEGEMRALKSSMDELTNNIARLRGQLREIEIQAESQMQARGADLRHKEGFDPLEFDRFTRFQELTRLMAESVNDVQTVQQNLLLAVNATESALASQARLNRDLQQDLMRVRMVPVASLSERLYRIVQRTAKELGRRANLDIRGGNTELDRAVLERITAPFEHLLRNAVSHGIESPDRRAASGKSEMGDIRLEVSQEGNEVRLSLADDGAGLDLPRIRARALELGLLSQGAAPSDAEIADLIFQPGLSTADAVSQVSGRGVGMDVVRSEVAALGGRVEVATSPGAGSRFTVYLPLTLAVTQAVLVRAGACTYAVPAVMVEQVSQFRPDQLEVARQEQFASWQERRHAFHYLPQLLGVDGVAEPRRLSPVMFLKSGSTSIALLVDELLGGNQEIVVKAIGPQLQRLPGIVGATVLCSAENALILNPVQLARHHETRVAAVPAASPPVDAVPAPPAAPAVMVVDDSLTVRKFTGRLLERQGYAVMIARDGVEALERLQKALPDVMLVDIEMPRMDGFDLTRNVRADPRLAHIPIVIISSRTADKHRDYARELGVNEFLGKPYPEEELLALIAGFVQQRRT